MSSITLTEAQKAAKNLPMTEHQLQLVLGTLLGDGCLSRQTRHPKYYTTHGAVQESYCRHKADVLSNYVNTRPKIRPNAGYGKESCVFGTLSSPAFDWVYDLAYTTQADGTRKKSVSADLLSHLTIVGAAYWFMDDGAASGGTSIVFSTHGFPEEQCQLLANWLTDQGFPTRLGKVKKKLKTYYTVRLRKRQAWDFQEAVRPHIHPSMLYKLVIDSPLRLAACKNCEQVFAYEVKPGSQPKACGDWCRMELAKASRQTSAEKNRKKKNARQREWYYQDTERARQRAWQHAKARRERLAANPEAKAEHLQKRRERRAKKVLTDEQREKIRQQNREYYLKVKSDPARLAERRRKANERRNG